MSAVESLRTASKNRVARWSFGDANRDRDPDLAVNRIFNGYFEPEFKPKFTLPDGAEFFAIGSCFAREIETTLIRQGRSVNSRIKEIETHPDFPVKPGTTTIHDLFNRYNVPSIVSEIRNISPSTGFTIGERLIYEGSNGIFDDLHYTPAAESATYEQILRRRRWLSDSLAERYRRSGVVVITLGLAEAWYDHELSSYLNVVSSPQMLRRYDNRLEVKMVGVVESLEMLGEAVDILKQDRKKVIMTVSPVPLQVTFLDKDIVICNNEAKSILRALCSELSARHDHVDYFPSYEMVSFSERGMAWRPDGRHVQMEMVQRIMAKAIGAYLS